MCFRHAHNLGDKIISISKKMMSKNVKIMVTFSGKRGGCDQDGAAESFRVANRIRVSG